MNSRVDKYYDKNNTSVGSRTSRNTELYKEISKTDISGYELRSNATVIGNNSNNIDVEKIKSILDTHYNDTPRRRTIPLDNIDEPKEIPKRQYETKEYDINVILDRAKEDKVETYDEERARKMHNTQFDILSSLNLDSSNDENELADKMTTPDAAARELEKLINTISINEKEFKKAKEKIISEKSESTDPLDIFSDLKGGDNTAILDGLQEKTEEIIHKMEKTSIHEPKYEDTTEITEKTTNTTFDNTFFTKSNAIKEKDFEDFRDIDELDGPSIFIKILISILLIVFIIGIGFLVKTLL